MEYIQLHVTAKPIPLNQRVPGQDVPAAARAGHGPRARQEAEERFASAADFAAAMQAVLRGATAAAAAEALREPPAARPPMTPTPGARGYGVASAPAPVPASAPTPPSAARARADACASRHRHPHVAARAARQSAAKRQHSTPRRGGHRVPPPGGGARSGDCSAKSPGGDASARRETRAGYVRAHGHASAPLPDPAGGHALRRLGEEEHRAGAPLAERMRPQHARGPRRAEAPPRARSAPGARDRRRPRPSMILWGPPGAGKTTLARVIAGATQSHFVPFSAVLGSVAELREIVAPRASGSPTTASGRSSSSTRSTASTRRSRTRSCRTSRTGRSRSSARPPRTRRSR